MSSTEILNKLKSVESMVNELRGALESVGTDRIRITGDITVTTEYEDHKFIPEIEVNDSMQEIDFGTEIYFSRLSAEGCDIYVNFDRPITDDEYTVVWKGTQKIINRKTSKIYVRAPAGLTGTLKFEGLKRNA